MFQPRIAAIFATPHEKRFWNNSWESTPIYGRSRASKIAAVGKKPNVRFAMSEPEPYQIQPILDWLQKILQTVLENQNQRPEVKTGETNTSNSGGSKKKNSKPPSSTASNGSNSTQGSDWRSNQGNDPHRQGREHYQDYSQNRNWHFNLADSQYWEPLRDQMQKAQAPRCGPPQNDRTPPRLLTLDQATGPRESSPWRGGCYFCGERNCHSQLHRGNPAPTRPPPESRRPPPRRTLEELRAQFTPWRNYPGCLTWGRQDCCSTVYLDPPRDVPPPPW